MSSAAAGSPLLLVVDDEPSNVEVLCDLLEALDYRTVGVGSGPAALAAAAERRPDLVLLDVMMPGMDGYEVCRRLRADPRTAGIPVVFVTALSGSDDKVKGIEAGDDFLTKPFSRPVLVARIRSLLRMKEAQQRLAESYRRLKELEELKDDLTRMVVHDLKSPLTGILGSLELGAGRRRRPAFARAAPAAGRRPRARRRRAAHGGQPAGPVAAGGIQRAPAAARP